MKKIWNGLVFTGILALMTLSGCKEDIDMSSRYVFKERTIASYLADHEQFSEYLKLLKEQKVSDISATSVYQLMTAYGYYTCFAPTNDAIQLFLDSLVIKGILPEPSWDAFPTERMRDSIREVLVMNSILDGTTVQQTYLSAEFPQNNEEFSINTMADRKISVTIDKTDAEKYYIDGICPVSTRNRDIETLNGYIHEIGYVINPSNETLGSSLHEFAMDFGSGFSVIGKLVEACNLVDTLSKVKDEVYEMKRKTGEIEDIFDPVQSKYHRNLEVPKHRKYGFTLFAETDGFWAKTLGKEIRDITVNDVKEWVIQQGFYPDAQDNGDYTNTNNVLNQFVTYHLLPMRLPANKLVIHYNEKGYHYKTSLGKPTVPVWAHYTTMGKRRLLQLFESAESSGVCLNRFPMLDNGRHGTYHELSCAPENDGIRVRTDADAQVVKLVNAVIYPIDEVLVYDERTRNEMGKRRIRYDIYDWTPEMMNNELRDMGYTTKRYFTPDEVYPYFEDLTINTRETYFIFLSGYACNWPNYQADEVCTEGLYDCTWRVPPVPKNGVYEIRMGVSTESPSRGICQIYFGTKKDALVPQGIPVDMALGGTYRNIEGTRYPSIVGWIQDTDDDDYNAEVDKKMRNNGFMKGPEYIVKTPGGTDTNRRLEIATRRIIVRQYMEADQTYYLRFKTVQDMLSKQLFLDYMEWCPKEVYDNPMEPEDIW